MPRGARVDRFWHIPSPESRGKAIFIAWQRSRVDRGASLWREVRPFSGIWEPRYSTRLDRSFRRLAIDRGDVTGDGDAEFMLAHYNPGPRSCGDRRVLTIEGRELLVRSACSTQVDIHDGRVRVAEGIYASGDGRCCPSRLRRTLLEWREGRPAVLSREVVRTAQVPCALCLG